MLRRLAPVLLATAIVLTGCASSSETSDVATPSADSTPTTTPTEDPTLHALIVGVGGVALSSGDETEGYAYDSPEPLLALVEELTGEPRSGEDFEDPWGNGEVMGTAYRWDDVTISVLKDGPASLTVLSTSIGGVPVHTIDGIAVGVTRDDVLAAGGWDEWDEDGDGVADYVGLDQQDVEGTQSLSRPGEVGREYVSVALSGDVVTELRSPANDFSDL